MSHASASQRSRSSIGSALLVLALLLSAALAVVAVRSASVGGLHADLGWLKGQLSRAAPDRRFPDPRRQVEKPAAQPAGSLGQAGAS